MPALQSFTVTETRTITFTSSYDGDSIEVLNGALAEALERGSSEWTSTNVQVTNNTLRENLR